MPGLRHAPSLDPHLPRRETEQVPGCMWCFCEWVGGARGSCGCNSSLPPPCIEVIDSVWNCKETLSVQKIAIEDMVPYQFIMSLQLSPKHKTPLWRGRISSTLNPEQLMTLDTLLWMGAPERQKAKIKKSTVTNDATFITTYCICWDNSYFHRENLRMCFFVFYFFPLSKYQICCRETWYLERSTSEWYCFYEWDWWLVHSLVTCVSDYEPISLCYWPKNKQKKILSQ